MFGIGIPEILLIVIVFVVGRWVVKIINRGLDKQIVKKCPSCGKVCSDLDATFCPHCGKPMK
ncbi:zinc-ribbon domain-containing protein [Schwartzia sp. (in: firmicutes)]